MDSVILFALSGNEKLADKLAAKLGNCEQGRVNLRHFPDGETHVNIAAPVQGKEVIVVASLDHPGEKFFALYFLAKTLKEQGAYSVRLIAPYLPYMRQDQPFQPGDCITTELFAHLLSSFLDEVITIDPHLHSHHSLSELYFIPVKVLQAAPLIARWVKINVSNAVLVGQDEESEHWVAALAKEASRPYMVLQKNRRGDRKASVKIPEVFKWKNYTPVLVGDIVSTARTMITTTLQLQKAGLKNPICIGVHGIFVGDAFERLTATGARVVTCNTIPHYSNAIDITNLIAYGIQQSVNQCLASETHFHEFGSKITVNGNSFDNGIKK